MPPQTGPQVHKVEINGQVHLFESAATGAELAQEIERFAGQIQTSQNLLDVTGGETPGSRLLQVGEAVTQTAGNLLAGGNEALTRFGALASTATDPASFSLEPLNVVPEGTGLPVTAPSPIQVPNIINELGRGMLGAGQEQIQQGGAALERGDLGEAAFRGAASIPPIGPFVAEGVDEAISGRGPAFAIGRAATEVFGPPLLARGIRGVLPKAVPPTLAKEGFELSFGERLSSGNRLKPVVMAAESVLGRTLVGGPLKRFNARRETHIRNLQNEFVDSVSDSNLTGTDLITHIDDTLTSRLTAARNTANDLYQAVDDAAGGVPRAGPLERGVVAVDLQPVRDIMLELLEQELATGAASSTLAARLRQGMQNLQPRQGFLAAHAARSRWRGFRDIPSDPSGPNTGRVTQIVADAIEAQMEKAATSAGQGLRTAWERADVFHRENVLPFRAKAVAKLAADPTQVGKAAQYMDNFPLSEAADLQAALGPKGYLDLVKEWVRVVFDEATLGESREFFGGPALRGVEDFAEQLGVRQAVAPRLRGAKVEKWLEDMGEARRDAFLPDQVQVGMQRVAGFARISDVAIADIGLSIMAGMVNAGIVGAAVGRWQTIPETARNAAGAYILSRIVASQKALNFAARAGAAAPIVGDSAAALKLLWGDLSDKEQDELSGILQGGRQLGTEQMRIVDESQGRLRGQDPRLALPQRQGFPQALGPPPLREQDPPSEQF